MSGPAAMAIATGVLLDASLKATVWLGLGLLVGPRLRHAADRHALHAVSLLTLPAWLWVASARGAEVAWDAPALALAWGLGALASLLPLTVGLWRLARLPLTPVDRVGGVAVFTSPRVDGPLTWGWLRPRVVLPAMAWDPGAREAALAHELAHVRRGDWLLHMLTWGVCALFWFHPLVWLTWRRMGDQAELAADDEAVAKGVPPSQLAAVLLGLASHRAPYSSLGAASSSTARRIRAVLDLRPRRASRWRALALMAGALPLALPTLGAWHPWTAAPETLTCQASPPPGLLP